MVMVCGTQASKEFMNLNRIYNAGIPAPRPFKVLAHVLTMEFIGKEGIPAPQLREAVGQLSERRRRKGESRAAPTRFPPFLETFSVPPFRY